VTLATGEKVTQEQEVEMAASGGGWTANKGGIMPKDAAKDRDRDRTGEDSSVVKGLNNVFTATQDVDFQDAEMQRYVEEQMMVRSGQPEEEVDTRTDYDKRRQELFEVPEEYRVRNLDLPTPPTPRHALFPRSAHRRPIGCTTFGGTARFGYVGVGCAMPVASSLLLRHSHPHLGAL
jgi:hypothetical protein